jgi:hypothetical protein
MQSMTEQDTFVVGGVDAHADIDHAAALDQRGCSREAPTVIITNHITAAPKFLIGRYARRMTIEQRLAEAIRAFHLDSLSSGVPLNVDLDVVLSVLTSTICAALRRRLPRLPHRDPSTPPNDGSFKPRRHPQKQRHNHRPTRPPRLLTRPAQRRCPRHDHPWPAGRPAAAPPRISEKVGPNSPREKRR